MKIEEIEQVLKVEIAEVEHSMLLVDRMEKLKEEKIEKFKMDKDFVNYWLIILWFWILVK
jgi:hypothetical protein